MSTVAVLLNPAIESLDLEPIRLTLMTKLNWSSDVANAAIAEYRLFLQLCFDDPDGSHHPSSEKMDHVWHQHILHTRKYMQDCLVIFARYLHHKPNTNLCEGHGPCSECGSECVGGCSDDLQPL